MNDKVIVNTPQYKGAAPGMIKAQSGFEGPGGGFMNRYRK